MKANETRGPDPELSLEEIQFGLIGEGADSRQQDLENSKKKQNYQFAPKERDREMRKLNERSGDEDGRNDGSVNPNQIEIELEDALRNEQRKVGASKESSQ